MSSSRGFSARQSMYPTAPSPSHWSALEHCSAQLGQASLHLQSSIDTLDEATRDFPRLASVIESNRVYDLVPSREIHSAQLAIDQEMRPQIHALVSLASSGLERLKQSERRLRDRVDKRELDHERHLSVVGSKKRTGDREELDALETRLLQLRETKERLRTDVDRLEREVETRLAGRH